MDGFRVLISGTSRGIGNFLAKHYLKRGFVVFGCSRSESSITNSNYKHFKLDITDEEKVREMFKTIRQNFAGLDALINNAGIMSTSHALLSSMERVKEVMDTNYLGTYLLSKEASKLMKKGKFGRIVNFSSLAVPLNLEGESAYIASKAAIESLTKVLSFELAPFLITVNTVGPSLIETEILSSTSKEQKEHIFKMMAQKDFGELADVSNVVDFFIDRKSSGVTGQTIYLGGAIK